MTALRMLWKAASENDRLAFLRELAIPFPANTPIETAQQALLNLTDLEWQELYDWLGEKPLVAARIVRENHAHHTTPHRPRRSHAAGRCVF